jgi:hypothetical protein
MYRRDAGYCLKSISRAFQYELRGFRLRGIGERGIRLRGIGERGIGTGKFRHCLRSAFFSASRTYIKEIQPYSRNL